MGIFALGAAFAGGLVSFLSPCVLPIIPGFLSYLAGSGAESRAKRSDVFLASLFFVLGFASVFSVLGVVLNRVLGAAGVTIQLWLSRIGGAAVIFFGLYLLGFISIGFLDRDHKFRVKARSSSKYVTSFIFGLAFAAGWTPCVGPALGAIIGLAISSPISAFALFFSYALGLGLPFLIVGAFAGEAARFIAKHERASRLVSRVFGLVLIVFGVLIFTQSLSLIGGVSCINSLPSA